MSISFPDTGKDWRQEQKGTTEDTMVGWHHWLDGHEFEQTPGIGDGQGSLVCCSPWGHKESDMTEQLNWSESYFLKKYLFIWLHWVLVAVLEIFNLCCGVFSCDMWDLVLWSGIKPGPPALRVQSLSHWATWEVPLKLFLNTALKPLSRECLLPSLIFKLSFPLDYELPEAKNQIVCRLVSVVSTGLLSGNELN